MPARRRDSTTDPFAVVGCTDVVPIGSGGTSIVYRAYQPAFDRLIALKVLTTPLEDERSRRRFARELALAGRLTGHPNVVTVFASGFLPDERGYVEMEYCPGGSLMDRVAQQGPLPAREVCSIGVKLAGVLELARQGGIVHRDVKPANVLVTRFGEPALSDFGIATIAGEVTGTTTALTPVHAAPEVLESREVGSPADQWSLASTLYTLLAGRAPFAGAESDGMLAGMLRILSEPVPAIPRADVPGGLRAALERAMAKDPSRRWPGPAAFAEALQGVEREEGWPVTLPVREVAEQRYGSVTPANPGSSETTDAESTQTWRRRGSPLPAVAADAGSAAAVESPPGVEAGSAPGVGAGSPPGVESSPAVDASLAGDASAPVQPTRQWSRRHSPLPPPAPAEAPSGRSRTRLWVTLSGVAVLIIVAVVAGVLASSSGSSSSASHHPGTTVTPGQPNHADRYAPRHVEVAREEGATVILRWTDPNNGQFPYVVRVSGNTRVQVATGSSQTVVEGLTPGAPYCFQVGAVYAVGLVSFASPVCVNGGQAATSTP